MFFPLGTRIGTEEELAATVWLVDVPSTEITVTVTPAPVCTRSSGP